MCFRFRLFIAVHIFPFQTPVLSDVKELYKRREVRFVLSANENYRPTMRSGCSYRVRRFQSRAGGKIFILHSHVCLQCVRQNLKPSKGCSN